MRKHDTIFLVLALSFVMLSVSSCSSYAKTVAQIVALNKKADSARDVRFDINQYFSVLNHIEPSKGCVLDYLYYEDAPQASAFAYLRKKSEKPIEWDGKQPFSDAIEQLKQKKESVECVIVPDGTQESYFEKVVLDILEGRFHFYPHSGASSIRHIITSRDEIKEILDGINSYPYKKKIAKEDEERMLSTDVSPQISFLDTDTAEVRLVVHEHYKDESFYRATYKISRTWPYNIVSYDSETLFRYDLGKRM